MSGRAHSFLSPKCYVHPAPDRGGHTVVAREGIAKDELIVVWSGTLVSGEELNYMPPTVRRYSLQVEENQYLVSLSDCEPPDYVNHSCEPNAQLFIVPAEREDETPSMILEALRTIRPGQELTIDYAWPAEYAIPCQCQSSRCRGWIVARQERHLVPEQPAAVH